MGDSRPSLLRYRFRSFGSTVGESIERYWSLVLAILVLTAMVHEERKRDTGREARIRNTFWLVDALPKKKKVLEAKEKVNKKGTKVDWYSFYFASSER